MRTTISRSTIAAVIAGLVFGVGLLVSGMTQPSKVLGFLDFAGDWDPSLAFVMGGAIFVHALFARLALRSGGRPVFAETFDLPSRRDVDTPLLAGAAFFGIGWGIAGYCPGPALVSLASPSIRTTAFVVAMGAGMLGVRLLRREPPPLVSAASEPR
jgi:uncharacterized membrane protein YedE/YeeE